MSLGNTYLNSIVVVFNECERNYTDCGLVVVTRKGALVKAETLKSTMPLENISSCVFSKGST